MTRRARIASPKNHRERVSHCITRNHSEMVGRVTAPKNASWLVVPRSRACRMASWSSVSNRQYPKHLRPGSSSCSPRCSCRSCAKDGNGRWLKTLVSAVKT